MPDETDCRSGLRPLRVSVWNPRGVTSDANGQIGK